MAPHGDVLCPHAHRAQASKWSPSLRLPKLASFLIRNGKEHYQASNWWHSLSRITTKISEITCPQLYRVQALCLQDDDSSLYGLPLLIMNYLWTTGHARNLTVDMTVSCHHDIPERFQRVWSRSLISHTLSNKQLSHRLVVAPVTEGHSAGEKPNDLLPLLSKKFNIADIKQDVLKWNILGDK
ncbi:hypothetical protein BDR03DRAFT_571753 [Suillus americanus]|nr:hypothetical protein BDR03DRAFT_571753 [Suillus americanus]